MVSSEHDAQARILVREQAGERVVTTLSGGLDLAVADDLLDELRVALDREGLRVLALDMAAVDFCDCAVLRVLIRVYTEGEQRGCRVVIAAASPVVAWLLRIVELADLFGYPPDPSSW